MNKQEFLQNYIVERRGTNCYKWDDLESRYGDKDLISMWIADMEFKTCDAITNAMIERTRHGVFGYSSVDEGYFKAFSNWMESRYNFPVEKDWVRFSTGCVTGIAWMIHAYTNPGDTCMILSPVYYPFYNVVTNNNRKLAVVGLNYEDGYFTMDYEAIEKAIVEQDVKMFIQCSPHNPAGRVWTEEELSKVLAICKKHNVLVISDEIHQDIVLKGHKFVPAAVVENGRYRDIVVTLNSASKTFNLAGLPHSHIIITDAELRARYDVFASGLNRTEINIMGAIAAQAGYEHGTEWLDMMMEVVEDNYQYLVCELNKHVPDVKVCKLEGSYLVMLDLRKVVPLEQTKEFVQDRCRLAVDFGEIFGEGYEGFIRLNLATDPRFVQQATANIIREANALK